MFETLARLLVQRSVAWGVVVGTVVLTAVCVIVGLQVERDDDLLAFLPRTNPDIQAFYEINDVFGSVDTALVGIRAVNGDVFSQDFLTKLGVVTKALRDTKGLDSVLTLSNIPDFVEDPVMGGIVTTSLVDEIPADAAAEEALRTKVMSRDHIVGTFVSEDARSVLLLAFAARGSDTRQVAMRVQDVVNAQFGDHPRYWGGGPFFSTWIYDTTQADMRRLTPFAVIAIVVIMMVAFRDPVGTGLGLVSTAIGIAVSRAAMVFTGATFNIVLSSMPVILFAVGSAYAIHMLSRYYHHHQHVDSNEAVARTVAQTGPTVLAAGLTTVAGLLSFLMMDIAPMRTFGVFTAVGIFTSLVLSLTFVPAVIVLWPRPVRAEAHGPLEPLTRALANWPLQHRTVALGITAALAAFSLTYAFLVDTRMDMSSFFEDESPPAVAQRFLDEEFGGSQYIQVHVRGDLKDPHVLREIGRIGDRIAMVPYVSSVNSIVGALSIINDAMSGARRVPDTAGQLGVLYRFLASDPAVSRLVDDAQTQALMAVKISSNQADDLEDVLAAVEAIIADDAIASYRIIPAADPRLIDLVASRLERLGVDYDVSLPDDARAQVSGWFAAPRPAADPAAVEASTEGFLRSEECWVELDAATAKRAAAVVTAAGPEGAGWATALSEGLDLPEADATVQDLLVVLEGPVRDFWREEAARADARGLLTSLAVEVPATARGTRFRAAVAASFQDRDNQTVLARAEGDDAAGLAWVVSGQPVLYRGLSRSVTANQFRSLGMALSLVLIIMTVLYRSLWTGLLATAPTALTLAVIYGGMGLVGVHLDVGTSMIASIIIGAGVDYAVHLLAAWEADESEPLGAAVNRAVGETSHAIWTNAIMVSVGFFILTLGDAKPLQNVGGLTSAAMIAAAVSTFFVIPLFARKRRYGAA